MAKRMKKWIIIWIFCLVGVPTLIYVGHIAFMFLQPPIESYLHSAKFDSNVWKKRSIDEGVMWPTRLRMIDDLLGHGRLDGLSSDKVRDLLGPKDDTDYFREWDLMYNLGPERGFIRIDSEWLVVRFDAVGIVNEYRIVRD